MLGVDFQDHSTYESELRPDGTIFGHGQGMYTGKGGEIAAWTGSGVSAYPGGPLDPTVDPIDPIASALRRSDASHT